MRTFLFSFLILTGLASQLAIAQNKPATAPAQNKANPAQASSSDAKKSPAADQKSAQKPANPKEAPKLAVPVNVLETFYAKYQKTKEVVWKQVEKEYVVNFKLGEHPLEATFAPDGQWLHTAQNISVNQLPRDIIIRIGKQPALKMKSAKKAESYQRGVVYEVTVLKDGQPLPLLFLPNGRLVSGEGL